MKWYKRDPDAWRAGVISLSPEQRGVYDTVIEVLYSYNGELPKDWDEKSWARECNCNPRTWRKNRDELLAKGKLYYESSGQLMAKRVRLEVERVANVSRMIAQLNLKRKEKQQSTIVSAESLTRLVRKKASYNGEIQQAARVVEISQTEDEEPKEVADKKRPDEISRQDLEAMYAAKRTAGEE